jgi:hypothetical protein
MNPGIRQHRQAMELEQLGTDHYNNSAYFQADSDGFCFDVPQQTESVNGAVIFENTLLGVTPVCKFNSGKADFAAFNVLASFSFPDSFDGEGLGPFLSVLFIICKLLGLIRLFDCVIIIITLLLTITTHTCALLFLNVALAIYFATSSDSGSLVVDHLASNGRRNHHWIQRLFWAVTEGAVATAVLSAGGKEGLQAVQAASIVFGLPFVFILVYMMQCMQSFLEQAVDPDNEEYTFPKGKEFSFPVYGGIFNLFEWIASLGSVNPIRIEQGMDKPTNFHMMEFFTGALFPSVSLYRVLSDTYPRNPGKNIAMTVIYTILFYGWVGLFGLYSQMAGLKGPAWAVYFASAMLLCTVRMKFRSRFNIRSNGKFH